MPFTNDDLKRLKEHIKGEPGVAWVQGRPGTVCSIEFLDALIARLEAAENVIHRLESSKDLQDFDWFIPTNEEYKAWRKECGDE